MSKRGRPRKDGVKPVYAFPRTILGLHGYDKARTAGEKYDAALEAGIAEVRHAYPDMPMSVTEMKRVLAEFRPKNTRAATFLVAECENFITPDGRMSHRAWSIDVGPQPSYPRHNARSEQLAKEGK